MKGWTVTAMIEGANPLHPNYPLLPGDFLVEDSGPEANPGDFLKVGPGLAIGGFRLTDEQRDSLQVDDKTVVI